MALKDRDGRGRSQGWEGLCHHLYGGDLWQGSSNSRPSHTLKSGELCVLCHVYMMPW
jgi:hypothetical protein